MTWSQKTITQAGPLFFRLRAATSDCIEDQDQGKKAYLCNLSWLCGEHQLSWPKRDPVKTLSSEISLIIRSELHSHLFVYLAACLYGTLLRCEICPTILYFSLSLAGLLPFRYVRVRDRLVLSKLQSRNVFSMLGSTVQRQLAVLAMTNWSHPFDWLQMLSRSCADSAMNSHQDQINTFSKQKLPGRAFSCIQHWWIAETEKSSLDSKMPSKRSLSQTEPTDESFLIFAKSQAHPWASYTSSSQDKISTCHIVIIILLSTSKSISAGLLRHVQRWMLWRLQLMKGWTSGIWGKWDGEREPATKVLVPSKTRARFALLSLQGKIWLTNWKKQPLQDLSRPQRNEKWIILRFRFNCR